MKALISSRIEKNTISTIESFNETFDEIYIVGNKKFYHEKITKYFELRNENRSGDLNIVKHKLPDGDYFFFRDGEKLITSNFEKDTIKGGVGIAYKDFIRKELRICKREDLRFDNWHSEMLLGDFSVNPTCFISAPATVELQNEQSWMTEEPTNRSAQFYQVINLYYTKQYDKFISSADHLLFTHKIPLENELWLLLYMSYLYFFKYNLPNEGVRAISLALCKKPEMAEFWCIIGDYYYKNNMIEMSIKCYNYALQAGKLRDPSDVYFMFPKKYKEHPESVLKEISLINK